MQPLRIFIGYDSREVAAYHVFAQSIIEHASVPVSITPLVQPQLRRRGIYTRAIDGLASTEFSLTRFLVPALCDYRGYAIFADCDMLALADVHSIFDAVDLWQHKAVWVAQHDYTPKRALKMDGQANAAYPRKNWSSFMLFNCGECRALTPEAVNTRTPSELHRFAWVPDEKIGSIPLEFNWLVGEYEPNSNAKLLHFTEGGPWFPDHEDVDHADLWYAARAAVAGRNVHRVGCPSENGCDCAEAYA